MAIDPIQETPFTVDDPTPAATVVADLVASGEGWVNLAPDLEADVEPPRRNLFSAIFSSRGPIMPLATVSPASNQDGPLGLGLQHGGGTSALHRLATEGHPLPEGWWKVSDHPRRGMVISAPGDADPRLVVEWLLRAADLLTEVDFDGAWVARLYRP